MTIEKMKEIASMASSKNIAIASHDDDDIKKLNLVKSLGTTVSEFPITLEVAKKARELGLQTIVGPPNVLMGGPHHGNLSAAEAVKLQRADILCSNTNLPAL